METTTKTMKINDEVKGLYYGLPYEGVIEGYGYNHAYVRLTKLFVKDGEKREWLCVDLYANFPGMTIELVKEGSEVECEYSQGFCRRA